MSYDAKTIMFFFFFSSRRRHTRWPRDWSSDVCSSDLATEDSFKKHAKDFRVIHLGTYGIIDENSPLFSRLIFAKDSIEDGYLHTYEIYGQQMEADLAVLMACETGAGAYTDRKSVV